MEALKKIVLGFLTYILAPTFCSINIILALFMAGWLGIGLFTLGYNGEIFIYFLIFFFLIVAEIIEILFWNAKNLLKYLWPNILNITARTFWVIFASTGLYELIFNEGLWSFAAKVSLSIDLWILVYNLPVAILHIILCRKKYREYLIKVLDEAANK